MLRSSWLYAILNPLRVSGVDQRIRALLMHPDPQIGWLPSAYFSARRIVSKREIRVLYSSSAPLTSHLIAYLTKKKTGLPWIAEFRDEWLENPDLRLPTSLHRRLHYRLEEAVVRYADKVVVMAPAFAEFLSKHSTDSGKFLHIPAGFDPDDYLQERGEPKAIGDGRGRFTMAFTGLFYGSFRPDGLLKAVTELIQEHRIRRDEVKIQFVGANSPADLGIEDSYGIFHFTGFVPRREALRHLMKADALLLLLSKERGDYVLPTKTFEYVGSGKPILALVPSNGETARILRKFKTARVVDFDDLSGTKSAFLHLFEQWRNKSADVPLDRAELARFDLRSLTGDLATVLDDIMEKRTPKR